MTLHPPSPSADEQFYARALAILAGPTRRMALLMRLVNVAYWVGVLSALGWLVGQGLDRSPPVTVVATTLLTPAVRSGEPVRIRYAFTRHRTCETDTSWLVFDGAQEVTRFGPVHASASGMPGDETLVRSWSTPAGMAPGQGRLRLVTAFACPGNYLHAIYPVTVVQPDVPFTIPADDPRRAE